MRKRIGSAGNKEQDLQKKNAAKSRPNVLSGSELEIRTSVMSQASHPCFASQVMKCKPR
jgi:hypothetical protein